MIIANIILCFVAAIFMLAHSWGLLCQTPPDIGHGFAFAVLGGMDIGIIAARLLVYFFWEDKR